MREPTELRMALSAYSQATLHPPHLSFLCLLEDWRRERRLEESSGRIFSWKEDTEPDLGHGCLDKCRKKKPNPTQQPELQVKLYSAVSALYICVFQARGSVKIQTRLRRAAGHLTLNTPAPLL